MAAIGVTWEDGQKRQMAALQAEVILILQGQMEVFHHTLLALRLLLPVALEALVRFPLQMPDQ
jgi:hypothetical protein